MTNQIHYSLNEKDDWITPPGLVSDIENAVGTIHLDPCAHELTSYGELNHRLEDNRDGLELPWSGNVFVNPPFSYKEDWLAKAVSEIDQGNADIIVMLTPDSTDVISWWHTYIAPHAEYVCFKEGRLNYVREATDDDTHDEDDYVYDSRLHSDNLIEGNSPTFGTAISVFASDDVPDALVETLHDWGHVMQTA